MDKIKAFFAKLRTQLGQFWQKLTTLKKIITVGVLVAAVAGIVAVLSFQKTDPYEYLFVNLGPEDATAISNHLKKANFTEYLIDDKGIKVPTASLLKLRLQLAEAGLPTHGQVGWEKFDSQEFTRTEFEQQINKLRAIQGELERTIMSIDGILSARVHVVIPKQVVFVEDQKEPTAAIYIKTKREATLDKKQIKGIVHLVSNSVEGLNPNNVIIIDSEGKMLTAIESQDPSAKMTKERMEYKTSLEKDLEQKIRGIVGRIVGQERVEAKVDVEVDFTQESQTISDIDPDKVVPIAKRSDNQSYGGTGLNPTGIPGAKSNVPGEEENVSMTTSQANNKKDSETVNYEIAKTVKHKTMPIGNITRISASVLVDGKQEYPIDGSQVAFVPRTDEEMKKITELVKNAIGFDDKRTDQIVVHNMMFQLDPFQTQVITEKSEKNKEYITTLAISAALALALVLFFAFIVRPYFRWLSYDPERKKEIKLIDEFKPDLELGTIQNVQIKEEVPFEKLGPQEQIMFLARHEPKRTTEAIRMLLNPHAATTH